MATDKLTIGLPMAQMKFVTTSLSLARVCSQTCPGLRQGASSAMMGVKLLHNCNDCRL